MSDAPPTVEQTRLALSRLLDTTDGRVLAAYIAHEKFRRVERLLAAPGSELVAAQQEAKVYSQLHRLFEESRGIR